MPHFNRQDKLNYDSYFGLNQDRSLAKYVVKDNFDWEIYYDRTFREFNLITNNSYPSTFTKYKVNINEPYDMEYTFYSISKLGK